MSTKPRLRRSLIEIQAEYERGDKQALETLMRAWKGIKELHPKDLSSFFVLGGYHGEPFRDQGVTDPAWWGGFCEHGTVLFPTWHRAYLYALEKALQSIPGCEEVMLPFWDETSAESLAHGIPAALTWETFELDGEVIPNPLRSFVLPVAIADAVHGDHSLYSKPAGYETVRYPLSGLVGTAKARAATAAHNAKFLDYAENVETLNANIVTWLNDAPVVRGKKLSGGFVHQKYVQCLDAPNYTVFSNKTSATAYNEVHKELAVMPLESPHNSIHLAVGGFDVPKQGHRSPIRGANGDMGENDTAALDPIFYFHHCFIDYVLWIWQRRHDSTGGLTIEPDDPGAGYSTNVPPPAGRMPGERLTAESPLNPFTAPDGTPMTTADVADITELGYDYGPGSLDPYVDDSTPALLAEDGRRDASRSVHVRGIDRNALRGSFVISAFAEVDGEMRAIGHEAILSRWQIEGCANCQSHLEAGAVFPLPAAARASTEATADSVHVQVTSRHDQLAALDEPALGESALAVAEGATQPSFTVEVR